MHNKIIKNIIDIHTHFGPYGDFEFSPEEIVKIMKNIGLKGFGIMQSPMKNDDYMPDNHKLLEIIELAGNELDVIPILMTSPAMIKKDPQFKKVADIPYKIIKIHPYAHNWAAYPDLIEIILNHAKDNFKPVMIHTGYDESEPNNFEKWLKKYPEVDFILAHAKPFNQAFEMIKKYQNVWVDISFMDKQDIKVLAYEESIKNRILFGTDIPATELFSELSSEEYFNARLLELKEVLSSDFSYFILLWGSHNIQNLLEKTN
jgi:hypothetical protein